MDFIRLAVLNTYATFWGSQVVTRKQSMKRVHVSMTFACLMGKFNGINPSIEAHMISKVLLFFVLGTFISINTAGKKA